MNSSNTHVIELPRHANALSSAIGIIILGGLSQYSAKPSAATIPHNVPILKNTIPFVFKGLRLLEKVRRDLPGSFTVRIPIFRDDIYLVRGPRSCLDMFQNSQLIVTRAYSIVLEHCFGMKRRAVDAYIADTSGSRQKPIQGSNASLNDRISFLTHNNLVSGLLQEGLEPSTKRFLSFLNESLEEEQSMREAILEHNWRDEPDLSEFFQHHIGSSLVKALFGEQLLLEDSDFMQDLWTYDHNVIRLIQRMPSFWIPKVYQIRDRLLAAVKRWHHKASTYTPSNVLKDESEPQGLWATTMIQERHSLLSKATGQDRDSVASTDLAFIWASVTNVVPSTTTLVLQIFDSPEILTSLQSSLDHAPQPIDYKYVESIPLLNSMYAETLRFGVQIHIPRTSPFQKIRVGGTNVPKNRLIIANTWLAHTDEEIWNTQGGRHPLDEFWGERFLVVPGDGASGPTKHHVDLTEPNATRPYFSLEGLEGSWIPFGGGQHACPGRLLAKRIMLMTAALLINKFDIEIQKDSGKDVIEYTSDRFGFGVRTPRDPVRFRMRRRH